MNLLVYSFFAIHIPLSRDFVGLSFLLLLLGTDVRVLIDISKELFLIDCVSRPNIFAVIFITYLIISVFVWSCNDTLHYLYQSAVMTALNRFFCFFFISVELSYKLLHNLFIGTLSYTFFKSMKIKCRWL